MNSSAAPAKYTGRQIEIREGTLYRTREDEGRGTGETVLVILFAGDGSQPAAPDPGPVG